LGQDSQNLQDEHVNPEKSCKSCLRLIVVVGAWRVVFLIYVGLCGVGIWSFLPSSRRCRRSLRGCNLRRQTSKIPNDIRRAIARGPHRSQCDPETATQRKPSNRETLQTHPRDTETVPGAAPPCESTSTHGS